jgi:hypothetical protein
MRASKSAGLGDEANGVPKRHVAWTTEHIATLREIRDAAAMLAG